MIDCLASHPNRPPGIAWQAQSVAKDTQPGVVPVILLSRGPGEEIQ